MLALIYTYYNSANLYKRQVQEWNNYTEKDKISIYVIDDCSDKYPLSDEEKPVDIEFYRYVVSERFNGQGGRNIGAFQAKENKWLFFSDIDHLLLNEDLLAILNELPGLDEEYVYIFNRQLPNKELMKPHGFTFLMTSELFWKIGGHDERLSGLYHGTCGAYKQRLKRKSKGFKRLNIALTYLEHETLTESKHGLEEKAVVSKIIKSGNPLILSREYSEIYG